MVEDKIVLDMTKFKNFSGKLVSDQPLELKLIEYYRLLSNEDNDPFILFTSYILKYLYQDQEEHKYDEIVTFFKESYYVNVVMYFLDMLEIYILNKVGPDCIDIKFNKYIENGDILKVEFTIIKKEDDASI